LKKCEEEDQVLPCEISSFVHPHFEKINPVSPINKSGNSNISESKKLNLQRFLKNYFVVSLRFNNFLIICLNLTIYLLVGII